MKTEFKARELKKICEVSTGSYDTWIAKGYIRPTYPSTGSGVPNLYTVYDLVRVSLFKCLLSRGFAVPFARDIAFLDPNHVTDKLLVAATNKAIEHYKKLGQSSSLLGGPERPKQAFVAFFEKDSRPFGYDLSEGSDFRQLTEDIGRKTDLVLIDLMEIALRLVAKVK